MSAAASTNSSTSTASTGPLVPSADEQRGGDEQRHPDERVRPDVALLHRAVARARGAPARRTETDIPAA